MAALSIDEVAFGVPSPAVRGYVSSYVGYHREGLPPGIHRGLPSLRTTFIISLGAPVRMLAGPEPLKGAQGCDAFVAGLHTSPTLIQREPVDYGLALDPTPLGLRALLGLPASELAATTVPLEALLGSRAEALVDQLRSADTWPQRFQILDAVLSRLADRFAETYRPAPELVGAWQLLSTDPHRQVSAAAHEVGWSRRHLLRAMTAELGVSPAEVRRLARFGAAVRMLRGQREASLAMVAARAGYFDQAHMTSQWRSLAGCTPTQWLADEVLVPVDVASVQDIETSR